MFLKAVASCVALSSVAYAGAMGPVADDNLLLTIPYLNPGFGAHIAALWLKPAASNLNYTILNTGLALQSSSWVEQELKPSFHAAFELGLRYVFLNSGGKDINIDWTHFDGSKRDVSTAADNQSFVGPDYEIGPDAGLIRQAAGIVKFKYDGVNLDGSQYLNFGQHLQMQFFGGLGLSHLKEEIITTFSGNTIGFFSGPFSMRQQVQSDFTGVGPRIGLHADYNFNSGFGFSGEAAGSVLIGSISSKDSFAGSSQALQLIFNQTTNYQTISDERVYQVIPGFSGKLGVNYQQQYQDMHFKIEAGYQAMVLVNAISQYLPGSLVANQGIETGSLNIASMSHTLSNYSMQGPFINFSLHA